jgi:hypothetical protein
VPELWHQPQRRFDNCRCFNINIDVDVDNDYRQQQQYEAISKNRIDFYDNTNNNRTS